MTMTHCRSCGRDVHITHSSAECDAVPDDGSPNLSVPMDLRGPPEQTDN